MSGCCAVYGPGDNIGKLGITVNTYDVDLILDVAGAGILEVNILNRIAAAGFPKDFFAVIYADK